MPRKKKPGPKPKRGRPSSARRREYERGRAATERENLRIAGYEAFTMFAPVEEAGSLRRTAKLNRLEGLIKAAEMRGDDEEAERLTHRHEIARIEVEREIQAENAERQRLRDKARRAAWDAQRERQMQSLDNAPSLEEILRREGVPFNGGGY